MDISEVGVTLAGGEKNVLAYAEMTVGGCLAVKSLKVIEAGRGLAVAMPSRKLTDMCPGCHGRNELSAKWCNWCGGRLEDERFSRLATGRPDLHRDLVFPTSRGSRAELEGVVLAAYKAEVGQ